MVTKWTGAAWFCMALHPSPPVTCSPQQAHAQVWAGSHAASPHLPATPSPLAAPCSLTAHTSVAQSALWTRMSAAALSLATTASQPTRGADTPTATMTLDPEGWRQRPERLRRGVGSGALMGRKGVLSSARKGGQCQLLLFHNAVKMTPTTPTWLV